MTSSRSILTNRTWYFVGTGSWFAAYGVQSVLFSWLVTIVLHESPEKVGLAQMAMLLPGLFLMLLGGSLADRFGGKRIAILAQLLAALPSAALALVVAIGEITFALMLVYAVAMGTVQAFVTPARDSMLNAIARGRIQRTVMLANVVQFGVQIGGFAIAATADTFGAVPILLAQSLVLLVGAVAFRRIHLEAQSQPSGPRESIRTAIVSGLLVVRRSSAMLAVSLVNMTMGVCFMGSYIVGIPLLVRDVYAGGSSEIALMNIVNSSGLVLMVIAMLRLGDVEHKGRALLLAHLCGAVALGSMWLDISFWLALVSAGCWGAAGGVAMSMSRTIMQESAPENMRGRVMAVFSLSFMGAGPVGAMASGWLVDLVGPRDALLIASGTLAAIVSTIALVTPLWTYRVHGEGDLVAESRANRGTDT